MEFITPPNHYRFRAKKIFGTPITGTLTDCSIALIEPNGGGPKPMHQHPHDHFFIVINGEATIYEGETKTLVKADEAIYVKGDVMHSIWNESDAPLKMIGITIKQEQL